MKSKFIIFILYLLFTSVGYSDSEVILNTNYLKKPTGQYGVGYDDFHWINQNVCPDFNFNGKNKDDFSPGNTKYCHELFVRIYYPTTLHQKSAPYSPEFIKIQKQFMLKQVPTISKIQLEQLTNLKSFSLKKAAIISDKKFPVLMFSPGFGCPAGLYENLITELVSQGYIVVAINTTFINLVTLPGGHVVKSVDLSKVTDQTKIIENKFVPLQSQDLIYVYEKLHKSHRNDSLFEHMDLNHIGVFGHSIGGHTLVDVAHAHPTWFQAIAPLDIGTDQTGNSLKKLTIPVMYQISANRKMISFQLPVTFELGNNGYLVGISPNEHDHTYSHHMNFTDFSTLQYLPAYKVLNNKSTNASRGF